MAATLTDDDAIVGGLKATGFLPRGPAGKADPVADAATGIPLPHYADLPADASRLTEPHP
jgi:hypothetical protein